MKLYKILSLALFIIGPATAVLHAQNTPVKNAKPAVNTTKQVLLNTDKAFCKLSLKSGTKTAFLTYADKDAIKMDQNNFPIIGLDALKAKMKDDKEKPGNLIWTPVKADVAKSKDLGYTFGNWQYPTKTTAGKDTTLYGNYVTIWKKQKDGKWKFVLDTGTNTPMPKEK